MTFSSRLEKGPRLNSQSILPSTSFALAPQALSLAPTPFCHINHLSERVDETKERFFGLDYSRPKNLAALDLDWTSQPTSIESVRRFPTYLRSPNTMETWALYFGYVRLEEGGEKDFFRQPTCYQPLFQSNQAHEARVIKQPLTGPCFLKKLSGVRMLTTFYLAKNDHRWVTFISLKTIAPGEL